MKKIWRKFSYCRKHNTYYRTVEKCPYCSMEQMGLKIAFVEVGKNGSN